MARDSYVTEHVSIWDDRGYFGKVLLLIIIRVSNSVRRLSDFIGESRSVYFFLLRDYRHNYGSLIGLVYSVMF